MWILQLKTTRECSAYRSGFSDICFFPIHIILLWSKYPALKNWPIDLGFQRPRLVEGKSIKMEKYQWKMDICFLPSAPWFTYLLFLVCVRWYGQKDRSINSKQLHLYKRVLKADILWPQKMTKMDEEKKNTNRENKGFTNFWLCIVLFTYFPQT